jgi:uncharacterized protein (DUF4415 family)
MAMTEPSGLLQHGGQEMRKKSDTVRYTAKQIKTKIARGDDRTNWAKVNAVTGARLEASIRADGDDVQGEPDWSQTIMGIPPPKDHINIRIDHDVLQWFRSNGRGYQTLMNNVLRAFVQMRQQRENTNLGQAVRPPSKSNGKLAPSHTPSANRPH